MACIPSILKKYCQNGVEFKTLGEIATEIKTSSRGAGRDLIDSGDSPAVFIDDIFKNVFLKKSISFINEDLITGNKVYCYFGDVVLISRGFYSEDLLKACAYLGSEKILVGNNIYILKHSQNPLYLAFALSLKSVENQKQKLISDGTISLITIDNVKKIKIPLPPLEIQNKISNILKQFWEKKEKLREFFRIEAQEREKQFEFFKEKLFKGLQEFKTLGEITTEIKSSTRNVLFDFLLSPGNSPILTYQEIKNNFLIIKPKTFINEEFIKGKAVCNFGDILIISRGDLFSVGKACAYIGKENCFSSVNSYVVKHSQNPLYLAFALSLKSVENQKQKLISDGTISLITIDNVKKIKIPLPPLEIQNKISNILKQFWEKKEELKKLLEKEFYLREKQFELIKESLFYTSEQP